MTCFDARPRVALIAALLLLAACSGGSHGSSPPPAPTYAIGGTVSGLNGSGLKLANNNGDSLTISGNGGFTFAQEVAAGGAYSVTVLAQPVGPIQTCRVSNGSGMVASSAITSVTVTCKTPLLSLFAGNAKGPGSADGTGDTARFLSPEDVATDAAGNIYVVDYAANTIRKITPQGVVSTVAGAAYYQGSADGSGAAALFNYPRGIAADSAGNLYVGDDTQSSGRLRHITPAGLVSTPSLRDAYGAAVGISPGGMAIDHAGNLYMAESYSNAITRITPAGDVSTFAGVVGLSGSADGAGNVATFYAPEDIAIDVAGNFYVADTNNVTIRMISASAVVSTFAGTAGASGSADGTGAAARFDRPTAVASGSAGNVYVVDNFDGTVRKITPAGVVTTLAGTPGVQGDVDGTGAAAQFNGPTGIAANAAGDLYVADYGNSAIRQITPAGVVTTLAGTADNYEPGSADGIGTAAQFFEPDGMAKDPAGNIYIVDSANGTIRKLTPDGTVTTLAGTAGVSGTMDGVGAAAQFCSITGIASDAAGNLYVADGYQSGGPGVPGTCSSNTIRKITLAGVVSTFAGQAGTSGSADGTGAAARFTGPQGIAIDRAGNLYVTDTDNQLIRKVTPAGVVTTLAGEAGVVGIADGTAKAARFFNPTGIAVDSAGNLFISDTSNSSIRRLTTGGIVSTFAGTSRSVGSADGSGAAARFAAPQNLSIDGANNLYVADYLNGTIRKITPAGAVSTVVGVAHQLGFSAGELPGVVGFPKGVLISGTSLYVTLYNGVAVIQDVP